MQASPQLSAPRHTPGSSPYHRDREPRGRAGLAAHVQPTWRRCRGSLDGREGRYGTRYRFVLLILEFHQLPGGEEDIIPATAAPDPPPPPFTLYLQQLALAQSRVPHEHDVDVASCRHAVSLITALVHGWARCGTTVWNSSMRMLAPPLVWFPSPGLTPPLVCPPPCLALTLRTPPHSASSNPALTMSWPKMEGHSACTSWRS